MHELLITIHIASCYNSYACGSNNNIRNLNETIYSGKNGNDANPGSIDKPFKTIIFARDYIRQLKNASKFPVGGVVVNIRHGSYDFTSEPFSLSSEDSGRSDSPIV